MSRIWTSLSHIWISHVTHLNESCHTCERSDWKCRSLSRCVGRLSHMWISHVTHVNESCHTYERVVSHIWMSHVPHVNDRLRMSLTFQVRCESVTRVHESCHTCERVMPHIWTSRVTHTNESCHTYAWVMSHTWMIRLKISLTFQVRRESVARVHESCHTYDWVMSHICHRELQIFEIFKILIFFFHSWVFISESQILKIKNLMSDSWVLMNESCQTWGCRSLWRCVSLSTAPMCIILVTHAKSRSTPMHESCYTCEWVMFLIQQRWNRATWLHHMCDRMRSCMWHGSFLCVTWCIHMCDMTHLCHTYNFTRVSQSSHMWDQSFHTCMNASYQTYDWVNESCRTYEWVMSHTWMSHDTHMWMSHDTHTWMSHDTHMCDESCHTYEWVMAHKWVNLIQMNESCHTYTWVISRIWMSHVTRMNESWHPSETSHGTHTTETKQSAYTKLVPKLEGIDPDDAFSAGMLFTYVPWLISFMCVPWLISFMCVPWLISFMCVPSQSMFPKLEGIDPDDAFPAGILFTCVPWLIHVCAMTHSCVCHDSFMCVPSQSMVPKLEGIGVWGGYDWYAQ